ncbi:MAG: methylmalonyl Co-A mutase-associated GTPase MeaB [Spirochaetota bacterium]
MTGNTGNSSRSDGGRQRSSPATIDPAELAARVRAGKTRAIARAVTIVESDDPAREALVDLLHPHTGRARVIGVTGPPGAGKSSLIDRLIGEFRGAGDRVAVIAVDPTSPFSGGALLGDRLRMGRHATDPGVYIRSMATRGHGGGLALATGEAISVLDAARFDPIIVETVGVGQSEVEIISLADVILVVIVPGAGDEIQALKAGIMEIGDIYVVNKADRDGAEELAATLTAALRMEDKEPRVRLTSATEDTGVTALADEILATMQEHRATGELARRRSDRKAAALERIALATLRRRLDDAGLFPAHGVDLPEDLRDTSTPYRLVRERLGALLPELRPEGAGGGDGVTESDAPHHSGRRGEGPPHEQEEES